GLKWNQTSTAMAYPYAIPGVINIYTINPAYSWLGANKGWGYFYNWELSAGVDCGRVPVTATVACSLPVELLTFEAFSTSGKVLLTWETASEKNTSHFIVQRSSDGINFESIGTVKANGNSNSPLLYSYIDYSPMHGTSYYRLLPYDSDGTFGTGPVKSITNNHTGIIINPNPNSGSFNISFTTDAGTRVKLTLINPLGQTVQEETLQSSSGEISRDMNIQSLASGIYFLHIEGADQKSISKIVKE
ncbi:MAG: T9SS type A sorting domain-containing protein, partial [Cytophagaceae bacterium]